MKNWDIAVARQAAEIDALNSMIAELIIAHAMFTGDARPLLQFCKTCSRVTCPLDTGSAAHGIGWKIGVLRQIAGYTKP